MDITKPLQLLIANVDYDGYKGKLGIGRILNGKLNVGDSICYGTCRGDNGQKSPKEEEEGEGGGVSSGDGDQSTSSSFSGASNSMAAAAPSHAPAHLYKKGCITELLMFNKLGKESVTEALAGDIVCIVGVPDIAIGDTVMDAKQPIPLPGIVVEEPTVRMHLMVNKSPLSGKEGKYVQSRTIRDRLYRELEKNVALKVYSVEGATDCFEICGRGQLHLNVLVEAMRREGFEMMLSPPTVIEKVMDGGRCEPFELLEISVPSEYSGAVVDMLNKRRGEMLLLQPSDIADGHTVLHYSIATRCMSGIRSNLLTCTKGTAVIDTHSRGYYPHIGDIVKREKGSILASESGVATPFGVSIVQEKGKLFITPKTEVYKEMIIGVHCKPGDITMNVCKTKQLTNMRVSGTEGLMQLDSPLEMNLDIAVEYIQDDELVEVTPLNVRILKNPDKKKKK